MAADRSYDGDLALWAEDQARALRGAGRARSNLPIDWENVAEETDTVLHDSPSLGQRVPGVVAVEAKTARRIVGAELTDFGEQPRADWDAVDYSADQVLGDWFPG